MTVSLSVWWRNPRHRLILTYRHPLPQPTYCQIRSHWSESHPLLSSRRLSQTLYLQQTPGTVTSIAHSPVLEGLRRVEGRWILSTCAVSLMMETSQPCRAGTSPGILELDLRTLLMARKEAAYRGLGVEGGCDQELKAGLSLLSHLFGTYLRKQPSVCGDFYLHTSKQMPQVICRRWKLRREGMREWKKEG